MPEYKFMQYWPMHPLNKAHKKTVTPEMLDVKKLGQFNSRDCWKYTYFIGISIFY